MSADPLPHLETFLQVAERNSFTGAARALGVTQAAVSQRIQTLEQEVGVALFRRQAGQVFLSEQGQRLHPIAQRILALHQEARGALRGIRSPVTGQLLLAASTIPGEHVLPAVLGVYRQKYPEIQVRVTIANTQRVLDLVDQGKTQLGLVGGKSENPHLFYRCFATDSMALIMSAAHPWKRRRRISLVEMRRHPLIVREVGSGSRLCLEQALQRAGVGLSDFPIALELGSNEAIKEAVRRGMGVTVLSRQAVHKELDRGEFHAVQVSGLTLQREMFVVWDRRRVLAIPVRLLLEDLLCPASATVS